MPESECIPVTINENITGSATVSEEGIEMTIGLDRAKGEELLAMIRSGAILGLELVAVPRDPRPFNLSPEFIEKARAHLKAHVGERLADGSRVYPMPPDSEIKTSD